MNIPTVGGARGIFEILVPGVFVLVNLVAVIYWLPFTDNETIGLIVAGVSNPLLSLVIAVILGYLIGVILRSFRVGMADRLSGKWLQRFSRAARKEDGTFELYAIEEFPYIGWIGNRFRQTLPPKALDFYDRVWAPRKIKGRNRQFFNFCKAVILSAGDQYASEIYAAEAMSRYVAGMLYALIFVFSLILLTTILRFLFLGEIVTLLVIILLAYLAAIAAILANFRFIRMKEVETVFTASYVHRSLFEDNEE